ncbi:tyrosine-type recombinase/integrase [Kineosporia sp. A_224]|uniref:tyrosine-type recombinase/integrase n=1 Tax=Kineosporia sp. A_224 TaxID=1962180 RepID=UPI0018E95E4F|nr:tyrosine-type recombinase/integrase [Kineosporia sp. A_224]
MTGRTAALEDALPPRWAAALTEWDAHAVVAGFTAATRKRRRRYLEQVAAAAGLVDPWQATTSGLEAALAAAGLAPVSTRDARGALRHFYGWACAAGRIGHDPARPMTSGPARPYVEPERTAAHVRANRGRGEQAPALNAAWTAAVALWSDYTLAGGRSPETLKTRRHYLAHFAATCADPWAATTAQLLAFLAVPEWSPNTRKSARGALRSFYRWATIAGHVPTDPALVLPAVRVPAAVPRPTPAAVAADARAKATPTELLMVDLALELGLRRAEIARVHSRDVEGDNLRVHGKGGRERLLPVPAALLARLRALPPGYAFPAHTGRPVTAYRVGDTLSALLGDGWSGHTLRHAAGTHFYERTGDVLVVSKLLGHTKPETSAGYVQVPDDVMRRAVDPGHIPAARAAEVTAPAVVDSWHDEWDQLLEDSFSL